MIQLFDTHTHFDVEDFDHDRAALAQAAYQKGVKALILIGFLRSRFTHLRQTQQFLQQLEAAPQSYLAPGLHPFYIEQHQGSDLNDLENFIQQNPCLAIGEIGLDYYLKQHKQPIIQQQQADFFNVQLELAKYYNKPVLLHIRKAHGDTLKILKQQKFKNGGISHAFSGGVEEAKAFIKMGFKIGITGQITNPNARRLRHVVNAISIQDLVLETDCPDMTPLCCQVSTEQRTRNTPANLPYVLEGLSEVKDIALAPLAAQLWQNSLEVLNLHAD